MSNIQKGDPTDAYVASLSDPDSSDPDDPYSESNPYETIERGDSLSQDESGFLGDGGCGDGEDESIWLDDIWDWLTGDEDDEDDDSSGLDGMEGDFDLSENEMFT